MAPQSGVQPSEELEHVTRRIIEALVDNDHDALANLISDDPCLIMVGTDEEEYWEGRRAFLGVANLQREEMASFGVRYFAPDIRAFRDGSFGWSVIRGSYVLPDGQSTKTRATYVFHLETGQWRLVHAHVSIGSSNLETIGLELTTSLESLAEFAESNRPDLTGAIASDGTVTIVFTDIEASTEIAERPWGPPLGRAAPLARGHHRVRGDPQRRIGRQVSRRRLHACVLRGVART